MPGAARIAAAVRQAALPLLLLLSDIGAGHTQPAASDQSGSASQIRRADELIESIGVNQHLGYAGTSYADASRTLQELRYLGIRLLRDQVPVPATLTRYRFLADAGIKFDLITGYAHQDVASTLRNDIRGASSLSASSPGSVIAVEGPNELNGPQDVLWHGRSSKDPKAAIEIMRAVSAAVRGASTLRDAAVVNVSIHNGVPDWRNYIKQLGDLSASVDFANWHVYFDVGSQPRSHVESMLKDALQSAPGRPVVFTEAGYTTAYHNPAGVDEATQAKNTLNLLLDAFRAGVKHVYLYELMEGAANPPPTDFENRFGLFHSDGAPKPAATAIHNLVSILNRGGEKVASPNGTAPGYSAAGLPETAQSILLTKAKGVFDVIFWNEVPDWDSASRKRISTPPSNVTVSFDRPYGSISIFDPLLDAAPIRKLENANSAEIELTDHPIIVEIAQR